MRGAKYLCLALSVLFLLASLDADARRRKKRRRKKKKAVATQKTRVAINKLLGKYKFGMSSAKVLGMLRKDLRKDYKKRLKAERDPLRQDRIRREMKKALKGVKKNLFKFTGKVTSWDSMPLVEKEFAHRNNESMVKHWGSRKRWFFFFHHNKVWKVLIAFNASKFNATFTQFATKMEQRFGAAERKYRTNLTGEAVMSHLEWPPYGQTVLVARENQFTQNFCLILINKATAKTVREARRLNSPKKKYSDPLVKAVLKSNPRNKGGSTGSNPNSDIVDQITGRGTKAPRVSDTHGSGSSGSSGTTTKKKKRKKLNPKDPLSGIDI